MKRILSLLLALTLALSLSVTALAAQPGQDQSSAQLLYNLNLFRGVGTNPDGSVDFALDRAPTRAEAATMLVRLLGKEEEALSKTWSTSFTDVPAWAQPYVGYAYTKGLTNGTDATHFGSDSQVTTAQYLTFLLRALGYQDGVDFTWSTPWLLTDKLGITEGDYTASTSFLRGDAAVVSANALYAQMKGSDQTLLQYLLDSGAIQNSSVVVWDYDAVSFQGDFASFLFYPVKGSSATFTSFKIDKVTVNGLSCQTLQVTTPEGVSKYLASIGYSAGGFGYIEIPYDEAAAMAAATKTYTDANGSTYPLLGFTFTYTGTQADGTTVSGTFTDYYYMDGDEE